MMRPAWHWLAAMALIGCVIDCLALALVYADKQNREVIAERATHQREQLAQELQGGILERARAIILVRVIELDPAPPPSSAMVVVLKSWKGPLPADRVLTLRQVFMCRSPIEIEDCTPYTFHAVGDELLVFAGALAAVLPRTWPEAEVQMRALDRAVEAQRQLWALDQAVKEQELQAHHYEASP